LRGEGKVCVREGPGNKRTNATSGAAWADRYEEAHAGQTPIEFDPLSSYPLQSTLCSNNTMVCACTPPPHTHTHLVGHVQGVVSPAVLYGQ
jgi:hypothetical protein